MSSTFTTTDDTAELDRMARSATEPSSRRIRVSAEQLSRVKFSYAARHAEAAAHALSAAGDLFALSGADVIPSPGDIVLAKVTAIGRQQKLEGTDSRRMTLFAGDTVALAYGNRYAADQYHAVVPDDLGPCSMVAAGGVAGRVIAQHAMVEDATAIEPIGILASASNVVASRDVAPLALDPSREVPQGRPIVIASLGTSMNSGKTTAAAHLVHGLARSGRTVGAAKVTGTGAGNDPGFFRDAGAAEVVDFTDYGFPTTFLLAYEEVRALVVNVVADLAGRGCDVIVIEIADGLFQEETRRLLGDPVFAAAVDRIVFSAADSLGAVAGVEVLGSAPVEVACVSGLLTASPLLEEEARRALDVPVVSTPDLARVSVATRVAGIAAAARS